jgi:hypothetical protein
VGAVCGSLSSNVKIVSLKNLSIFVKCKMVRHYIRKTERFMYPDGYILKAVKKVVTEKQKVCDVSKEMPPSQKDLY